MVELVDTQDLKSCDLKSRAGSIPALSTTQNFSTETREFNTNAKVAPLVEHDLAKVGVASSNLVFRSKYGLYQPVLKRLIIPTAVG